MTNVRIVQMGQTAVNRPFFEVLINARRYCMAVNDNGKATFKPRSFLQNLGVNSLVANLFEKNPSADLITGMGLSASTLDTEYNYRFNTATYGSGLAFSPQFKPLTGWSVLAPDNAFTFQF